MFAATDRAAQLDPREAEAHLLPAACLAKPITATLLAEAAVQHHINWSDEICDVLAVRSPWKAQLTGITLSHLLNHTHGLDASTVLRVPRTPGGFLDIESLCTQCAVTPLSPPGQLYSYSNVGAWFAGALLEQLSGRPYSQLLDEHHLSHASAGPASIQPNRICPATGGGLELTLSQWLAFLERHLQNPQNDAVRIQGLASLRAAPVQLPGWNPSEQGACLGWKYYGSGWFGHNANGIGSSALLRFNPEHDIAIVIEASANAAYIALAGLFGTALPELANLNPLRLLNPQKCAALELGRYRGTYVQAQCRLTVDIASKGVLRLIVETKDSNAEIHHCLLRPAEGEIFIPEPRKDPEFAVLQFVRADSTYTFNYVWNGKQLWRRE